MADNQRAKHGQPSQPGGQGNQKSEPDGNKQNQGGQLNKAPGNQGVKKSSQDHKEEKSGNRMSSLELARAFFEIPRFPWLNPSRT